MAKKKSKLDRYQIQQKFWLNGRDKDESELAHYCEKLRKQRQFAPTVRNGLTLMRALEQGDTTLLFQLFPNLENQLRFALEADILAGRENETLNHLKQLETMLSGLSLSAPAAERPPQLVAGGIRKLQMPQFSLPIDDEEEEVNLKVTASVVDGGVIAKNFLRSLDVLGAGRGLDTP